MAGKLPHDFEQKVRMAPAIGGKGYPYQLSAKDLMDNFRHVNGEEGAEGTGGNGLPDGVSGDILIHNGTDWIATPATQISLIYCEDGTPTTGTFLKI